jgi:hypothetical protein
VRGAEVVGYLTRDTEGSVAEIDCALVTARGVARHALAAEAPEPAFA